MNDYSDIERQLEEDLATAAALISGADRVALACHVAPDGDALGSMLALHHVLRAGGRDSVAAFAGTQVTGPHYRELPGLDLLSDPLDFPAEGEAEHERSTAVALRQVIPQLQAAIGRQVRMKYTPHLVFREDPAIKTGERVDEILRQLHSEDE